MLSNDDLATLRQLEESLWRTETRFDHGHMDAILAPDFTEFGRSGRTYSRAECLAVAAEQFVARLPLQNFEVRPIDGNSVLVTYVSEVGSGPVLRANRSSIWTRHGKGWWLRFHQGTPRD
jgi:hypothetical protein